MSAEEDVFEKLDALLRKHHPGAFNSPAAKASVERPAKKAVVIPLLTDIATPSIMALSSEEKAEIPVLTEVINLASALPDEAGVVDLDQEFERDLELAIALPEETPLPAGTGIDDLMDSSELNDESDFEQIAIGPGIEVPPVTMEAASPSAEDATPQVEEIIELTPILETPPVELIAPEPEDFLFAEPLPAETAAPPEEAPSPAPAAAPVPSNERAATPIRAPLEVLEPQAHASPDELAEPLEDTRTLPDQDTRLQLIEALDADDDVLIFDEMDDLPPEESSSGAESALKGLDEHLQRLVEEKLGPQLTATMDRALANMLDQFSTHIEYLVRESVALELQKQLEALRQTFAQQLSAQRANLDKTPEKDQ